RTLELALDPASLPADISLSVLLKEVRAIWAPYVDVSVTMRPGPPCFACRYRLDVRVADTRADGNQESPALGWIEFVDGEPQPVTSISTPQARRLVEHVDWNGRPFKTLPAAVRTRLLSVALGRAVAHEIGHYLLRSRAHAPSGLMRASYTAYDAKDP